MIYLYFLPCFYRFYSYGVRCNFKNSGHGKLGNYCTAFCFQHFFEQQKQNSYFIWILMKMWKRIFTFSLLLQQDFIQIKYNYISIHNWWVCRSIFLFRFQMKRHPYNKCFSSHFVPLFLVIFKKDNVILSYSKLLVFSTFHYAFNRNLLAFYQIDLPLSVSPLKALLLRKKEIIL